MEEFLQFFMFLVPLILLIAVTAVFSSKNPVYGVLAFIVVIFFVVSLLLLLDLEFAAYILAIVYIGAIVVLFIFVTMMLHIHPLNTWPSFVSACTMSFLAGLMVGEVTEYLNSPREGFVDYIVGIYSEMIFELLSYQFFNTALLLTGIAAMLMLIGIIGSIVLTVKPTSWSERIAKIRRRIRDALDKFK